MMPYAMPRIWSMEDPFVISDNPLRSVQGIPNAKAICLEFLRAHLILQKGARPTELFCGINQEYITTLPTPDTLFGPRKTRQARKWFHDQQELDGEKHKLYLSTDINNVDQNLQISRFSSTPRTFQQLHARGTWGSIVYTSISAVATPLRVLKDDDENIIPQVDVKAFERTKLVDLSTHTLFTRLVQSGKEETQSNSHFEKPFSLYTLARRSEQLFTESGSDNKIVLTNKPTFCEQRIPIMALLVELWLLKMSRSDIHSFSHVSLEHIIFSEEIKKLSHSLMFPPHVPFEVDFLEKKSRSSSRISTVETENETENEKKGDETEDENENEKKRDGRNRSRKVQETRFKSRSSWVEKVKKVERVEKVEKVKPQDSSPVLSKTRDLGYKNKRIKNSIPFEDLSLHSTPVSPTEAPITGFTSRLQKDGTRRKRITQEQRKNANENETSFSLFQVPLEVQKVEKDKENGQRCSRNNANNAKPSYSQAVDVLFLPLDNNGKTKTGQNRTKKAVLEDKKNENSTTDLEPTTSTTTTQSRHIRRKAAYPQAIETESVTVPKVKQTASNATRRRKNGNKSSTTSTSDEKKK